MLLKNKAGACENAKRLKAKRFASAHVARLW